MVDNVIEIGTPLREVERNWLDKSQMLEDNRTEISREEIFKSIDPIPEAADKFEQTKPLEEYIPERGTPTAENEERIVEDNYELLQENRADMEKIISYRTYDKGAGIGSSFDTRV